MVVNNVTTTIYKGDDSDAFGRNLIKVNTPKGLADELITKCIFQCGAFQQVVENPTFPFYINIPSEGSKKLEYVNECYLQLFDNHNKKITLKGNITILAEKQAIPECTITQPSSSGVRKYVR